MPVIIIGFLINGLFWGFATRAIIINKGYYENWFWWGFIFGFIAFIVACTKPQNIILPVSNAATSSLTRLAEKYDAERIKTKDVLENNPGSWYCSCGKFNAAYTGTCGCGLTKAEAINRIENKKSVEIKNQKDEAELQNLRLLREYKSLLDEGIITEDDYTKKKNEILKI